jgi:hypothetical protein
MTEAGLDALAVETFKTDDASARHPRGTVKGHSGCGSTSRYPLDDGPLWENGFTYVSCNGGDCTADTYWNSCMVKHCW